jgi:hypothetical protein
MFSITKCLVGVNTPSIRTHPLGRVRDRGNTIPISIFDRNVTQVQGHL